MKQQLKVSLAQLNLSLLDPTPLTLPPGKDQQLIQALIELLLGAASALPSGKGENLESETDS